MFEDLFVDRGTIARYRSASLPDERLSYLAHCEQAGLRPSTLRGIAADQTRLVRRLGLRGAEPVSMSRIESAADRGTNRPAHPAARRAFIGHAVRWLRFVGLFEEPCEVRHSHAEEVAAFRTWMCKDRGWSRSTVRSRCSTVDCFFDWMADWGILLESVGFADIDRAVARWHTRGCSRLTIRGYVQHLRTFLRFAEHRGWCAPGLADGIMPPRFHRGEAVPKGLNRDEVLRLLETSEGDRPTDVRDRAILMVLIAYGLRSAEVTRLQLGDLDLAGEMLRVCRPKSGQTHHYPLSRGVGQAIVRFVTEVRPRRPERALFLTMTAPIRPLGRGVIYGVVRTRLDRIGVTGKRRGPHALRHAAAQYLLDHGLSFKEIGDYLGHRSISSTAVYAKVQLSALREVADIDLEGLV